MSYVEKLLGANEKILAATKRHVFVLLGQVFKELLILIVLTVGYFAIREWRETQSFPFEIIFAAVAFVVLISILIDILRWSNEQFLVTTRRVIHSSGIFSKRVLDSSLNKINDVILTQSWIGRLLGFGTIKILTASDEVVNLLDRIANPIEFKQAMLSAKENVEPSLSPAATPASASQLLDELAQLRDKKMITEEEYQEKRKEILKRM
ncbi:MAG TPA: PH domain-containing protein [Acidobacteriota bacterium]|nr:PH domain-containing protein [Acidobacteriota bacterium]